MLLEPIVGWRCEFCRQYNLYPASVAERLPGTVVGCGTCGRSLFVPPRYACPGHRSAPPAVPEDGPPKAVVRSPGVYADAEGWGHYIAGPSAEGRWRSGSPDGSADLAEHEWNSDGVEVVSDWTPCRLVAKVAELEAWDIHDSDLANPAELARMLGRASVAGSGAVP